MSTELTHEVLRQLAWAQEEGVDPEIIKVLANPELNGDQVSRLRLAAQSGLSCWAIQRMVDENLAPGQIFALMMVALRYGEEPLEFLCNRSIWIDQIYEVGCCLEQGVPVNECQVLANPSLLPADIRQLRLGLASGIKLEELCQYVSPQLAKKLDDVMTQMANK